jgi:hypothetical protein
MVPRFLIAKEKIMTIPPRWSELPEEPIYKAASELCITCVDPRHDQCSITPGCSCCDNSRIIIEDQGNHNRFAANDTANDELYMGDEIGPIAGGIEASADNSVTASSWVTSNVLPDSSGAQAVTQDPNMPVDPSTADPLAMANTPGNMNNTMETTPAAMQTTASWRAEEYSDAINKVASDSDVFFKGYGDAISGKEMDEGMANLSMDYYQGYKQGLLYNQTNLESAPPNYEDINSRAAYPMQTSRPFDLDRGELSARTDRGGYSPK